MYYLEALSKYLEIPQCINAVALCLSVLEKKASRKAAKSLRGQKNLLKNLL